MTGIIAALLYGVICFFAGRKIAGEKPEVRFQKTVFWCLLAAGLLFRVVLGLFTVGYENDLNDVRLHHEIYLSDPRRVAAEKRKTVLRHPIKKA